MNEIIDETINAVIIEEYKAFLDNKAFPCIAAKAALAHDHVDCVVVDHMACPKDDHTILQRIYDFVDGYRKADKPFHSIAIIFKQPVINNEAAFEEMMWERLQSLRNLDSEHYGYDLRVDDDPGSANFSFSLKEEAFFIIALHPASSRKARQFKYPAIIFNPHAEFEKLRLANRYENLKMVVRKRDILYSGSVNPMLKNFGEDSEVIQYSGRNYDIHWKCPLKNNHESTEHHPPA